MDLKVILAKMEEMKTDFKMQNEKLAESFNRSLSKTIDEKLKPLLDENIKLKEEVQNLQSRVQTLERETRKNNIILHGVPENEANNSDLRNIVIEILNKISQKVEGMQDWDKWEISNVRRLGKKNTEKKRPILITLTLTWRKYEVLKNNKNFPSDIYATEDYPRDILIKRKELKEKKEQEERQGKIAFIRYDKLIVKDRDVDETKRKRSPSKSPKENHKDTKNITAAPPKKLNKSFDTFRARPNSASNETRN
ncbi:uncharacterized protein LOC114350537 isoform X2 [Ostrinia furnacalis]|uniref:uncharacterized protein LOC114350537 isoform X1 n=1 Tax=Ostrinia furnacalis TaxID=93504 RepID=UPI00103FCEE1|nr:uncharacterized protein LOC114350537 isoform X1 [Ostrinia furnacalis]XP_028157177.1 uncharacterized protein LOC114350537 isoform X2 [Ostrinia furnacalis]